MRKFILLIMSLVLITPCDAAVHSVTVEQLKQMLAAQQTAGKNDGDRAQQLNSLELTEQLTQPTLDRITAEFKPGPKTVLSLKLLADSSAFLEPPAGELLEKAPPDDCRAAGHDEIRHQFCRSHSTPYAGFPGDAPHRQLR